MRGRYVFGMQAARFVGNKVIEIGEAPRPDPADGEALVRVAFCGLCGSDKRPYRDGFPLIPGHEVSGTVVDANGTGIATGTRAAAYLSDFCEECAYCRSGRTNIERNIWAHETPIKVIAAMGILVHGGGTVDEAMRELT